MAMNTPQEPIQPTNQAEPQVAPEAAAVVPPQQPAEAPVEGADNTQQVAPEQEQQVVEAVAEGLAEDTISTRDILTAVLSDSLGVSASAANSLIDLFVADLLEEAQAPSDDVPM